MTDKLKKQLILNLPYLVFVYLFEKLCQGVRLAPGADASEKLLHIGQGFSVAFASLAPSFHLLDLCVGAAGAVLIRLAVYSKGKNAKKYRRGIEYGSARWGTPADIAPYVDKDFSQNVLLTQTERITMSSRPKEPKIFWSSAGPAAARRGSSSSPTCSNAIPRMWSRTRRAPSYKRSAPCWSAGNTASKA